MIGRIVDFISRAANVFAILMLVGMFLHIVLEMILRNLFSTSTFVLDEFVGYAMSALIFMSLGETFRRGGLIRVALLRERLNAQGQFVLDVFAHLAAGIVGTMTVVFVGESVLRRYASGTTSASIAQVPLWIPEFMVFIGVAVFLLRVLQSAVELVVSGRPTDQEA